MIQIVGIIFIGVVLISLVVFLIFQEWKSLNEN